MSRLSGEPRLAALLGLLALAGGGLNGFGLLTAFGGSPQDYGPMQIGYVGFAFGVAGLTAIVAAVVVDRRGPDVLLPAGALVLAGGMAAAGFANSFREWLIVAAPVGGGAAAIGSLILIALAAKGCNRVRGTAIGAISLMGALGAVPAAVESLTGRIGPQAAGISAAAMFVLLAFALYKWLPSVGTPKALDGPAQGWRRAAAVEYQADIRALIRHWAFWRVVVLIGLVMGLSRGLVLPVFLFGPSTGILPFELLGIDILGPVMVGAFGLLWGIASDRVPVKSLMLVVVGIAVISAIVLLLGRAEPLVLILFAIVSGAAFVLPWVMLADYIGTKYIATIGAILVISPMNGPLGSLGLIAAGYFSDLQVVWAVPLPIALYALLLALATAALRPLHFESGGESA